jgi:major membrane immunogen (membrane-anchored lipoprotein)
MKSLETQVGGTHYKDKKIQPIEYILANNLGYIEGNVVKYITRYKDKNGIEDLVKIKQYIDILIEHLNNEDVDESPIETYEAYYVIEG